MCGIGFVIWHGLQYLEEMLKLTKFEVVDSKITLVSKLVASIQSRGPDAMQNVSVSESKVEMTFVASLLALRGTKPVLQPLVKGKHYLLWNGEIFGGRFFDVVQKNDLNDGAFLLEKLVETKTVGEALKVISQVKGPYSFVYANVRFWIECNVFCRWKRSLFCLEEILLEEEACCILEIQIVLYCPMLHLILVANV